MPLHYQWFYKSKPIGNNYSVHVDPGDLYVMSEKAVGTDWHKKSILTLRHASGAAKYIKLWNNNEHKNYQYDLSALIKLLMFYLFDLLAYGLFEFRPDLLCIRTRLLLVDLFLNYLFFIYKTKFYNFPKRFSSLFYRTFIFLLSYLSICKFKLMHD